MCRMWWPLTLTYIFKVIWPWLWKSCLLCNVFSSRSIIFFTWDPIVWVIMRRRGVSSERRRSSCSSFKLNFKVVNCGHYCIYSILQTKCFLNLWFFYESSFVLYIIATILSFKFYNFCDYIPSFLVQLIWVKAVDLYDRCQQTFLSQLLTNICYINWNS